MKKRGGVVQRLGAILRCPPTPEAVLAAVGALRSQLAEHKQVVVVTTRADLEDVVRGAVRGVDEDRLLSAREVAAALGIKPRTWTEWLRKAPPELRALGFPVGVGKQLRFSLTNARRVLAAMSGRAP